MVYETLIYERKGAHVVKITVNRPKVLNAVDYQTITELKQALLEIREDPAVRALIITGAGEKSFIVGADQQEIKLHGENSERGKVFEDSSRATLNFIDLLRKPSVCAINGYTFGLGLQLALTCTFRIASPNARFGLPEINMGFFPSLGATQRLTRLVGEAKTTEMILTGDPIDAEEAYRIGLVNRLIPLADLSTFAENLAEKLAEKSPTAVRLTIEAIKNGKDMPLDDGLAYEEKLSEECLKSEDAKEGMLAFVQKRKANFKGR